jgi:hypothetical protein
VAATIEPDSTLVSAFAAALERYRALFPALRALH